MSDFDFNRSRNIRIDTDNVGRLSIDSVDTFREIAAGGDRQLFYGFAEAHGSNYGAVASVGCVLARTTFNPPRPAQNAA